MPEVQTRKIQTWKDLRFTVVAEIYDGHVDFKLYDIVAENAEGTPEWTKKGTADLLDTTPILDDAEPYLRGGVKWDGCSNWWFDEQERGVMLHGCRRRDLTRLGEAMAKCWDWASELIPNWFGGEV